MLEIALREAIPLSEVLQSDARVNWRDGGLAVAREGVRSVVHDGGEIIGDSLGGDEG